MGNFVSVATNVDLNAVLWVSLENGIRRLRSVTEKLDALCGKDVCVLQLGNSTTVISHIHYLLLPTPFFRLA